MDKKKILLGVGFIALLGVGYFVYRKIRTTSQSAEKNNRKIKIIGRKNVKPSVSEDTTTIESEI